MIMPDRNPFRSPDHSSPDRSAFPDRSAGVALADGAPAGGAAAQALPVLLRVQAGERIEMPWGVEEITAAVEDRYAGKILSIWAGHSLSLQHHRVKDKTLYVESGHVRVEYGSDAADLRVLDLMPGQGVHIRPGLLHRITAVADSRVLETSTAGSGWSQDIVRHADL